MKNLLLSFFAIIIVGCAPFNRPAVVQIETNETAFLVDMRSDDATQSSMTRIQRKDVIIHGYWVQTGRTHLEGHFRPEQRVLVVSRRPVEMRWNGENNGNVVRVTSRESVGFQVPITLNATIETDNDAELYLRWFRSSANSQQVNWEKINSSEWDLREEAESLESALNRIVFPFINGELARLFVQIPIVEAEIQSREFVDDVAERAKVFAKQYGITIILMSAIDGINYDDPQFQKRLDERALAILNNDVLEQQLKNAEREQEVRLVEANTNARVAAIEAQTMTVQRTRQEIENDRLKAIAEADAIRIRANKWNGAYPTTVTPEFGLRLIQ